MSSGAATLCGGSPVEGRDWNAEDGRPGGCEGRRRRRNGCVRRRTFFEIDSVPIGPMTLFEGNKGISNEKLISKQIKYFEENPLISK
jgi:hypothetical protein